MKGKWAALRPPSKLFILLLILLLGTPALAPGVQGLDARYRLVTLAKGSPLPGCNGAIVGPDGALYVTHSTHSTISRIDLTTRKVTTFVPSYAGVFVPDDITVDGEGNFYVTGATPSVGDVYRIDARGRKSRIASGIPGANGIHYNRRTGRLFVTECFWGNRVFEIDPNGVREPRVLVQENVLAVPEGFGFDPDTQDLIIPDLGTGEIVRVHPDTGAVTAIAEEFTTPVALEVGPDRRAYIVEMVTGGVYRLSLDGRKRERLAQLPPGLDNLALSPDGRLFVTSYWDATIFQVSTDGSGEVQALFPKGSNTIGGILAKGKQVLSCDWIMVRGVQGGQFVKTKLHAWATQGMPAPGSLANGPGDQVIWTDGFGAVAMGNPASGEFQVIARQLDRPVAALMNPEGTELTVAEYGAGQITVFSLPEGDKRVLTAGLEGPLALAFVKGQLYVAEGKAGRISRVDPDTGKKEVFLSGLVGKPVALGSGGAGSLLILDGATRRLYRVDTENLAISTVAADLPVRCLLWGNYPSYEFPWPMSVTAEGDIYLGTDHCGVIVLKKVK